MLREKELCYEITGCVYEVYRHLGHGFLEGVYQKALCEELQSKGLEVASELPVTIYYKDVNVGDHRLDLVVEDRVVIELKAQKQMPASAQPQLINYLKATGKQLGLLVNFAYPKATVKRVVL